MIKSRVRKNITISNDKTILFIELLNNMKSQVLLFFYWRVVMDPCFVNNQTP